MSSIKNHVQLMGNAGEDPQITNLDGGKKVANFSMAVNEDYKDKEGQKQTETTWAKIVAWGKLAGIVENYVKKGKEITVVGSLRNRSYTADDETKRNVTEIVASDILLMGTKKD